jgi:hypothetical protein
MRTPSAVQPFTNGEACHIAKLAYYSASIALSEMDVGRIFSGLPLAERPAWLQERLAAAIRNQCLVEITRAEALDLVEHLLRQTEIEEQGLVH